MTSLTYICCTRCFSVISINLQAILPLLPYLSNLFVNFNFLFNLPGLYSSSIAIFLNSSLGSLIAVLNPIVSLFTVQSDFNKYLYLVEK
ncbi:unnamed protein product [Meloidogyne enterolobii]|uniref:Uncharacterized protein n=1 Tax=Meloidogyne enterolobii TaxID=390850 RepID=A0ACB1AJN6_MELEN